MRRAEYRHRARRGRVANLGARVRGDGAVAGGRYHGLAARGQALDGLPGGTEWAASIEAVPEEERHLEIHRGHLVELNEHDRKALNPEEMSPAQLTGTPDQVRERLARLEAGGATELMWQPMGPDIERELRAFAAVVA